MKLDDRLIFSLFRYGTDEYKTTVLEFTYRAIKENNGITESSLTYKLKNSYGFNKSVILTALACLSNANIFGSISKFEIRDTGVTHLRVKESKKWEDWISSRKNNHNVCV